MAGSTKGRGIIDDTVPMMCTIEGIAKKEHVVSMTSYAHGVAGSKLLLVKMCIYSCCLSSLSQDYIMKVQRGISPDDSWQVSPASCSCLLCTHKPNLRLMYIIFAVRIFNLRVMSVSPHPWVKWPLENCQHSRFLTQALYFEIKKEGVKILNQLNQSLGNEGICYFCTCT